MSEQFKEFTIRLHSDNRIETESKGLQSYEILGLLEFVRVFLTKDVAKNTKSEQKAPKREPLRKTYRDGKVRYG